MFITIKFGDDKEELFNPDCTFRVLMNDIKKRCGCSDGDTIRLLDEKTGSLVPTPNDKSMDSAVKLFTERGCYIILLAEEKRDGVISYESLLHNPRKELSAIIESLNFEVGKPSKSIGRRASRTPQTTTKLMSGGKGRRK